MPTSQQGNDPKLTAKITTNSAGQSLETVSQIKGPEDQMQERIMEVKSPSGECVVAALDEPSAQTVDRRTGYGDFYISPQTMARYVLGRYTHYPPPRNISYIGVMGDESRKAMDVPLADMCSFQRIGSFPFFKLPPELRQKICRILLLPLYQDSTVQNGSTAYPVIKVVLHPGLKVHQKGILLGRRTSSEPQHFFAIKLHNSGVSHWDWTVTDLVRHVSHTCTRFRKEIWDIFWRCTELYCHDYAPDLKWNSILHSFMKERPAALAGIKLLDLSLDLYISAPSVTRHQDEFRTMCEHMSRSLNLETVILRIGATPWIVKMICSPSRFFKFLEAFRTVRVSKDFQVKCTIDDYVLGEDDNAEDSEASWEQKITQYMMPDTLRQMEPTLEMDRYLESRTGH